MQEKTLADIIKKARFKKGFSYEDLEEKSMIRMSVVQMIESGKRKSKTTCKYVGKNCIRFARIESAGIKRKVQLFQVRLFFQVYLRGYQTKKALRRSSRNAFFLFLELSLTKFFKNFQKEFFIFFFFRN